MEQSYLKQRTKSFALEIIKLVESLPKGRTADAIGRQLLDAGTSVGANYRAACRARSPADFISKMGIVEEEADETIYWMELLIDAKLVQENDISHLLREANQILAIDCIFDQDRSEKKQKVGIPHPVFCISLCALWIFYSEFRTPHSAFGIILLTPNLSLWQT